MTRNLLGAEALVQSLQILVVDFEGLGDGAFLGEALGAGCDGCWGLEGLRVSESSLLVLSVGLAVCSHFFR